MSSNSINILVKFGGSGVDKRSCATVRVHPSQGERARPSFWLSDCPATMFRLSYLSRPVPHSGDSEQAHLVTQLTSSRSYSSHQLVFRRPWADIDTKVQRHTPTRLHSVSLTVRLTQGTQWVQAAALVRLSESIRSVHTSSV